MDSIKVAILEDGTIRVETDQISPAAHVSAEQLLDTIHAAHAGTTSHGELGKVAGTMATRKKSEDDEASLTQRETQVLRHLALGLSNKEIAKSLSISVETVKEHVQHVLRKIGVNDRTQAAVWAVRKGIV